MTKQQSNYIGNNGGGGSHTIFLLQLAGRIRGLPSVYNGMNNGMNQPAGEDLKEMSMRTAGDSR